MKYKMTIHPAIEAGVHAIEFLFETAEQMIVSRDVAAGLLTALAGTMDFSNAFYLEELVNDEWETYIAKGAIKMAKCT